MVTITNFIRCIPKVELHAHLNGCIREETLFELAKERNVTLSDHHYGVAAVAAEPTTWHLSSRSRSPNDVTERENQDSDNDSGSVDDENQSEDNDNLGIKNTMGFFYNQRPRSLKDCFAMFAEIPRCVNDLVALERITMEALQDFASHHVTYVELRSTPKVLFHRYLLTHATRATEDTLSASTLPTANPAIPGAGPSLATKREYIQTILSVMERMDRLEQKRYEQEQAHERGIDTRLPMQSRFIVSVDRSQPMREAIENIQLAIEFHHQSPNSRVVGVDVGGNPAAKIDLAAIQKLLNHARSVGLKVTFHCAELSCGRDDTTKDSNAEQEAYKEAASILAFCPDRIGHALLLPPSLQHELSRRAIPVETCPSSNVMTLELARGVDGDLIHGLRHHPILHDWIKSRHPLAICTDDPGVFHTDMTKELLLVQRAFQLTKQDMATLVLQAIDYAFCSIETREAIKSMMTERLKTLLSL